MSKVNGLFMDEQEAQFERILDVAHGTPWEPNEDGLWCVNCGNHIAAPWNVEEGYEPPERCGDCGFPEFAA